MSETSPSFVPVLWQEFGTLVDMLDELSGKVTRSQLRDPAVLAAAARGPVEVSTGRGGEPLALLPLASLRASAQIEALTETFLRLLAALRVPNAPPVLFGRAAFVAGWDQRERQRFVDGFADSLAESIRTGSPKPAEFFLSANERAASRPPSTSPAFTGELSDEVAAALEKHSVPRR
jgi:hypothetical protein